MFMCAGGFADAPFALAFDEFNKSKFAPVTPDERSKMQRIRNGNFSTVYGLRLSRVSYTRTLVYLVTVESVTENA